MIKRVFLMFTICVMFLASLGYADDINGYMIPEYYMVGSHHTGEDGIEGQHGFWLRRIYFGYDTDLGNDWSARVRLEMNSPAYGSALATPYLKNAHLKKGLGGGLNLMVGIIEPPSFDKIEKFWGYRHIEKTAPDFFKFASSRDFGIALDGKTKGGIVYTLMYGNFGGEKGEANKGKGVYARLGWESKEFYLEANSHFASDNKKDITYLSLFGGLQGNWGRFGAGYHYKNEKPEAGDSKNNGIISAFGVITFGKSTELFARYDHLTDYNFKDIGDYIPVACEDFKARFVIAGLNFKIHKMVELSPNFKYVFYSGDNKPDNDFYLNLTAKVSFKSSFASKE